MRSAAAPKQRQVRLKEAQDQQRKEDTELAASYFDKFDVNNSGVLEEHQLGALLHDITGALRDGCAAQARAPRVRLHECALLLVRLGPDYCYGTLPPPADVLLLLLLLPLCYC